MLLDRNEWYTRRGGMSGDQKNGKERKWKQLDMRQVFNNIFQVSFSIALKEEEEKIN